MDWKMRMQRFIGLTAVMLLTLSAACAGRPKPVKQEAVPKPRVSEKRPMAELTVPQIQEQTPAQLASGSPGRLYTLRVREGRLKDVLLALARESGENLVVDPDVSGTVTIDLNRVTLEQALDAILAPLGYTYRKEGKVIRISRPRLETRIFTLNYINTSRRGEKKIVAAHGTGAAGGKVSGSESSITGVDQLDPWLELQEGLAAIIFGREKPQEVIRTRKQGPVTSLTGKDGKKLVISRMSGVVLVRDYPEKLNQVAEFLEQMEGSVQRQVLIQARILEVALKKEYKTGIRWDNIQEKLLNLDISTLKFSYNVAGGLSRSGILGVAGVPTVDTAGNPTLFLNDLVEALEVQGKVTTLASPRVATLNNQAAIVKITDQDVYFESENIVPSTGGNVLQSFTPKTVDIGVILDVTPQISSDGSIIMDIHPSFSEKLRDVPTPDKVTTFPLLSVRETDTVVRVRDGQTIIIGGLIKERRETTRSGLPCLMSLPLVRHGSSYTEDLSNKSELVILLTPTVLVGKRIDEVSAEELRRLDELKKTRYLR